MDGFLKITGDLSRWNIYRKAACVSDVTEMFIRRAFSYTTRTIDQMRQAARSCKQNIVEGITDSTVSMEIGRRFRSFGEHDFQVCIELYLLSRLVQEYEDVHYPVDEPSLIDILKLRMYEMGLSQAALAKKIGVSPSRICDFLSGKAEPTLKVGRRISTELQIDPAIVLGV